MENLQGELLTRLVGLVADMQQLEEVQRTLAGRWLRPDNKLMVVAERLTHRVNKRLELYVYPPGVGRRVRGTGVTGCGIPRIRLGGPILRDFYTRLVKGVIRGKSPSNPTCLQCGCRSM